MKTTVYAFAIAIFAFASGAWANEHAKTAAPAVKDTKISHKEARAACKAEGKVKAELKKCINEKMNESKS